MALPSSAQDPRGTSLSVVIPAFNEAPTMDEHLGLLVGWLAGLEATAELIVVDDGSTDNTADIVERWVHEQAGVHLIRLSPNRGRGAALRTGMQAAKGRVVVTTEADLSWSFPCLERLAARVASGEADVAVASPHRDGGGMVGVPLERVAISRSGNALAGVVLGGGLTMATGMTRAYRADILSEVASPLDGKEFHLDTLTRAIRRGHRVREEPAVVTWRHPGERRQRLTSLPILARTMAKHLYLLGRHALRRRSARGGRS